MVSSNGVLGTLRLSGVLRTVGLRPPTLPLLRFVRVMLAPLLRVRSISSVTLKLVGEEADRTRLIGTPFKIPKCHPHRFVEVIRIPPLEDSLQHFAYVETIFRQLYGILVVNQLVLIELSMKVYGWEQNAVLTRTRARVALTVLKICFAEEAPTTSLFITRIPSSRSDTLALRVRVAILTDFDGCGTCRAAVAVQG